MELSQVEYLNGKRKEEEVETWICRGREEEKNSGRHRGWEWDAK
jgi:hypothetical protein